MKQSCFVQKDFCLIIYVIKNTDLECLREESKGGQSGLEGDERIELFYRRCEKVRSAEEDAPL